MPDGWTDPGSLDGDALTQWYLRSPADIEQERQAAADRRYQNYFYGSDETRPVPADYSTPAPYAAAGAGLDSEAAAPIDNEAAWPGDDSESVPSTQDATLPISSAPAPDLTLRPGVPPSDEQLLPPLVFNSIPATAKATGPSSSPDALPPQPSTFGFRTFVAAGSPPAAGQTIAYGALRAPAPTDAELADLRRKQAAFGDVARKIDLQNAWFAAPVLAASALPFLPEAAARWIVGEGAPEAGQAVTNFIERDRYLRAGENYATKVGRRAHAWLEERLATKPGWDYEPDVVRPDARPLKPDVGTPQRNPADLDKRYYLELKPNTPTGRAAAARAVQRYMDATKQKVRAIYYDPRDFM